MTSGLRGFLTKHYSRELGGKNFHRLSQVADTLLLRTKQRLTEKTTWFEKKEEEGDRMLEKREVHGP